MALLLSTAIHSYAQPAFTYLPVKDDSVKLAAVKNEIRQHYLKDSAAQIGANKKQLVNIYRERFDNLKEMFTEKELMANAEADNYLNALANEIIKYNPELKSLGGRFLFSKVYWPNATSHGEGTIIFNIGLFAKLNTESEVIFTLGHEFAHLYLDHSNKGIQQYVNTVNSEEFQQELKEIKKSKYEQNKQLAKLEKGMVFKDRRHGRLHETEADSMAVVFAQRTPYSLNGGISCLGILDNIDKDTYDTEKGLPAFFNFAEYPFKKSWIKKEEAFFGGLPEKKLNSKEEDSLKTHPDCKVRIEKLKGMLEKINQVPRKDFVISEERFNALKQRFGFDIIEFCFTSKRISRCLYYSLELLSKKPGNAYLVNMIGKCFNTFYENQKAHTLNQVADLPSPYVDKNYNVLLDFLQRIRINDIAAMGYYFLRSYQSSLNSDENFLNTFSKSKENFEKKQ